MFPSHSFVAFIYFMSNVQIGLAPRGNVSCTRFTAARFSLRLKSFRPGMQTTRCIVRADYELRHQANSTRAKFSPATYVLTWVRPAGLALRRGFLSSRNIHVGYAEVLRREITRLSNSLSSVAAFSKFHTSPSTRSHPSAPSVPLARPRNFASTSPSVSGFRQCPFG
jgi:hypothetical protein